MKTSSKMILISVLIIGPIFLRMAFLQSDAKRAKMEFPVRSQCHMWQESARLYKDKFGIFPTRLEVLLQDSDCRKVLQETNLNDLWQTPLNYRIIDGFPTVTSAGQDKILGTSDDIHAY